MNVLVIVNPTAGAGRAQQLISAIESALTHRKAQWKLQLTTAPGHATRLAQQAKIGSYDAVVVVGGDGTINEVCQAYIDEHGQNVAGPALLVLPAGTGRDFARTFGPPSSTEAAIAKLFSSAPKDTDLGVVRMGAAPRAFANILSFGVSGVVARRVNQGPKWLGGPATFFLTSLSAGLVYPNSPLELVVDGEPWFRGKAFTVAIANGRFFGSGMQIAPRAEPHDGAFEVVVLGDLTTTERLGLSRHIYRGTHLDLPKVKRTTARSVSARPLRSDEAIPVDIDGETPGHLPLTAELLPRALRLYV